ncbi:MAG: glycosyltransferase family 4 protein [Candidatus Parcubacteria bacterium]|nr:glycosyltransferase family 4 protein [Candidatus Parcubacteria bacterium]
MKHKICYVLPEYKEGLATHFSYIERLLCEATKELEVFLIIEKGNVPRGNLGCVKIKTIGSSNFLLRSIKLKFWLLYARFYGYCDFYVHYSFLSAITASFIAKIFGGRVFYWNCGEPWKYKRSFLRERFERWTYRLVTFVVTGTDHLAGEYAKHYDIPREKILAMPNWIDVERFEEEPNKRELRKELELPVDKKIILFAHRLSLRKGSRMILPAARDLLSVRNDIFFAVVGTGPDEEKLRARAQGSESLRHAIHFFGAVPNREIQKYFAASDVFFMPSQEEGFPRVVLEAMASGVPIVASDVGSVSEIIPVSMKPFIVHPNDTSGFVRTLNMVLSQNSEQRQKQQKELRERAREFATGTVVKRFVKLFEHAGGKPCRQ